MSLDEHSGHLNVFDDEKSRASIGVKEYGDGTVTTWNKNGY